MTDLGWNYDVSASPEDEPVWFLAIYYTEKEPAVVLGRHDSEWDEFWGKYRHTYVDCVSGDGLGKVLAWQECIPPDPPAALAEYDRTPQPGAQEGREHG